MKLLILCNMVPGAVRMALEKKDNGGGLWLDHVLADLMQIPDMDIMILCRGAKKLEGKLSERLAYSVFEEAHPEEYDPNLEESFIQILNTFQPGVVHVWGTEYGHTLAMVNAAEKTGFLQAVVISIQGLISRIADHYNDGLPEHVVSGWTFRDFLSKDNLYQQQETFRSRGYLEVAALEKAVNVIGRTNWDKKCTEAINPQRRYFFCNETLRVPFYEGTWSYSNCNRHQIFTSGCTYPVKGFHYLLDAFSQVLAEYPDAQIVLPGKGFYPKGLKGFLRMQFYQVYLIKLSQKYKLKDKIRFLGHLSAEDMKAQMLASNVFVLPSTIENSPNSLGEAMLLGVPCVAMNVGGVETMLRPEEGILISDPAMLSHSIKAVFAAGSDASVMGQKARAHAGETHNPDVNLKTLLSIYQTISTGG